MKTLDEKMMARALGLARKAWGQTSPNPLVGAVVARGERVMAALHELDEVAYVRFASVYRPFKDLEDFVRELRDLLESRRERGADFPLDALNPSPKK